MDAIERWAKSWFLDPAGGDLLSFEGLPVGWALHIEVADTVQSVVLPLLGQPRRDVGRPAFRGLKRRGFDRAARAWGLRGLAPFGDRSDDPHSRVSIISELATPSTLDGLIAVADRLEVRPTIGVADPRALRRWRSTGHRVAPLILSPFAETRRLRSLQGVADDRWQAVTRHARPLLVGGADYTQAALGGVRSVVRRSIPWVGVEALALREFLDGSRPHTIVLASDQHRIGRLATHLSGSRGIRSIVIQHGLPQSTLGYLPVVADRLAVWSESSARWFLDHGTPADRLRIVGNPRLDWLPAGDASADEGRIQGLSALTGRPSILVALSVASVDTNWRLIDAAIGALGRLPEASLVIKLHPGGSDWTDVLQRSTWPVTVRQRTQVIDRAPIEPLLRWADVVVIHRSTVAGEALAAGCPVVVVETSEPSAADLELRSLELMRVADADTLASATASLTEGDSGSRYVASRRPEIERVMGPSDGRSADRAARLAIDPTG